MCWNPHRFFCIKWTKTVVLVKVQRTHLQNDLYQNELQKQPSDRTTLLISILLYVHPNSHILQEVCSLKCWNIQKSISSSSFPLVVSETFIKYPHYWSLPLKILWFKNFCKGRIPCRQPQNQTNLLSGALFSCRSVGRPVLCFVSVSFYLCIILFYFPFTFPYIFFHTLPNLLPVCKTLIILTFYELKDESYLFIIYILNLW